MISFKPTEEQEIVREAMHDFAEQAMRPIGRQAGAVTNDPVCCW